MNAWWVAIGDLQLKLTQKNLVCGQPLLASIPQTLLWFLQTRLAYFPDPSWHNLPNPMRHEFPSFPNFFGIYFQITLSINLLSSFGINSPMLFWHNFPNTIFPTFVGIYFLTTVGQPHTANIVAAILTLIMAIVLVVYAAILAQVSSIEARVALSHSSPKLLLFVIS